MPKGPRFNNTSDQFTTRDSLGIESATASIQGELCPVVTTVTPRAFYWIFAVWNYYDFYTNYVGKKETYDDFDKPFLKKNDYFFALSNILAQAKDQSGLAGIDKARTDSESDGPYPYNEKYLITRFGGMQYYNSGCQTLGFITDTNQDGTISYKLPRLTEQLGKPMALAFERVICNTAYYKEYRLQNTPVPKEVLLEFGRTVGLNLAGFNECKQLLREALFESKNNKYLNNSKLILSVDYIKTFREQHGILPSNLRELRRVLFDIYSPRGEARQIVPELAEIASDWEIVVGRQYFTIAIELIWKYMLEELDGKMAMDAAAWINGCLSSATWTMDINAPLSQYIPECNYTFEVREKMIAAGARGSSNSSQNIDTGIRVLLSLFNRFSERDDLNEDYMAVGQDVSLTKLILLIREFAEKPVAEFIAHLMINWIIKKHEKTATEKLYYGRDGFFFEKVDDRYGFKHSMYPDFQGIRLQQLTQVMKDLDMLEA